MYPRALANLQAALEKLPGIGRKGAERLALHLVRAPEEQVRALARALARLRDEVRLCSLCRNLADRDPCPICGDPGRERGQLCLVESPADLEALEAAGAYRGLYFVLAGVLAPLQGMGPRQLNLDELWRRLELGPVAEVIIATSATVEGEATASLLAQGLAGKNLAVTRLGYGLPVGGDLKYMDGLTLSRALAARRPPE